jgi:hypothetical protein
MFIYAVGSVAARIAAALCVAVIGLPYLLRRGPLRRHQAPYRQRLRPHFWIAYFVAGLTIVHVGTAMRAMVRANIAGVWCATGALLLLVFEIVAGLALRESGWKERGGLQRIHFWTAIGFTGSLAMHLRLNA